MDIKLTKDADKLICVIYKEYLTRIKDGTPKRNAKEFPDHLSWPDSFHQEFSDDDIMETIPELKQAGFIDLYIHGGFQLKPDAIIYMEQRFPDGISGVLEWMAKFKSAIPFL